MLDYGLSYNWFLVDIQKHSASTFKSRMLFKSLVYPFIFNE